MMLFLTAFLLLAPSEPLTLSAPAGGAAGLVKRGEAVRLEVGRDYVLRGLVKTEGVAIEETNRSSVPTGASLALASMPWDVHTMSLAGTRDWTAVELRFTATRAQDAVELRIAPGGRFRGKAQARDITVEPAQGPASWPIKEAVERFGPAYKYPKGGWLYLHIEGKPYDRGYQHGTLMAKEIPGYLARCAAEMDIKEKGKAWELARTIANAVFLRGFEDEILTEMKGIADGAAAAGAKWEGRKIDLVDIVAMNTITEIGLLAPAASITATGLETKELVAPAYRDPAKPVGPTERCSAFAATGKATRDGKMVVGHITMWPLTLAEQTNILLDIQPESGRRMLIQSYPGGVQSGTDWYQNDAGIVLTETTIRQSPFDITGAPVAMRARKAIQYGTTVDLVVRYLSEKNNGLYTNEWLIGDSKTDEIAMFELGTNRSRLWRSSKGEWFGGTEGFYWGCNNAKDLQVRLDYQPDPMGRPTHIPYLDSPRDVKWQEVYRNTKGQIDEQFAFTAFRTAPLVTGSSFDSKVTTAEMAPRMMVWALLGKPNEREWEPAPWQKEQYEGNEGIHSGGYRLVQAHSQAPESAAPAEAAKPASATWKRVAEDRLWKGWMLPATPGDDWITLGSMAYRRVLGSENPREALEALVRRAGDSPNDLRTAQAVLQYDAVRVQMGDDKFLDAMRDLHRNFATKTVRTADFFAPVPKVEVGTHPPLLSGLMNRLGRALIVFGTDLEAGSNRHAAELLQQQLNGWYESLIPIRRDFEVTAEELTTHTVVFIGRPETNSALREWAGKLGLAFDGASFTAGGVAYAQAREGLFAAYPHPSNAKEIVLVLAGNSPVETVRLARPQIAEKSWIVTRQGRQTASGF